MEESILKEKLKLSELFLSIQGETTFSGLPCIFIRLAGCNLRCNYCDTKYAYKTKIVLPINAILDKIAEFNPINLISITGGEPLLQKNVYDLFDELLLQKNRILLETNGSISLEHVPKSIIKIVDIKTPSSGMSEKMDWENLRYLDHKDEIKFVISDKNDFQWAINQIKEYSLLNHTVLFSPVYSQLTPKKLSEWILNSRLAIRLNLQIHKLIWKNQQGV